MKHYLALAAVLVAGQVWTITNQQQPANEDAFTIDEYEFTWLVAESGDASLSITKDAESTRVLISSGDDYLSCSPADAEKIGKAFDATNAQWTKLRRSAGTVQESIAAGKFRVMFLNNENGFSVVVSGTQSLVSDTAILERKQANALAPHLKRAVKMAAYVDRVIGGAIDR
jgi:hypothetical protein